MIYLLIQESTHSFVCSIHLSSTHLSINHPIIQLSIYACIHYWLFIHPFVHPPFHLESHTHAHTCPQDATDDHRLGLKSTALLFNDSAKTWLSIFATTMSSSLLLAGLSGGLTWPYYTGVGIVASHLAWQVMYMYIHVHVHIVHTCITYTCT